METATQAKPEGEKVTNLPARREREILVVTDPIAVLDTARFDQMMRIARAMAASTLIPESLCFEGKGNAKQLMPVQQIAANCFLVVNQAVRWGMDPFAVAQCVSVIQGKLCYEGKLIAAVINAKLGYDLEYELSGDGDARKVVVTAAKNGKAVLDSSGGKKKIEGTVAEWRTKRDGSPWDALGGKDRMLRYRGAREWCRVHAPGLMLGVYSDDELADMATEARASRARDVTPSRIMAPDPDAAPPQRQVQQEAPQEPVKRAAPVAPDPDAQPQLTLTLFEILAAEIKSLNANQIVPWGIGNNERLSQLTAEQRAQIVEALDQRTKTLNRA